MNPEAQRCAQMRQNQKPWRLWGPYLSERQWATVREDYSADGDAWGYFTHDMARSRAYRWGEDGLAGWSDSNQYLCFSLALWNGQDPILKERLFGLTNSEGNHGEDVKELYYYLDATPTHSYAKMLYKYPQTAFPYTNLRVQNLQRGVDATEFELIDTGAFDSNRYFDVFVEYAKASPEDTLVLITVHNRSKQTAPLHILPQAWFRNTWTWDHRGSRPALRVNARAIETNHPDLGRYWFYFDQNPKLLACENETNFERLYNMEIKGGSFKDAIHEHLIHDKKDAISANGQGTKAAAWYQALIAAHGSFSVRARITATPMSDAFADCDDVVAQRREEADLFYSELQAEMPDEDTRRVQRQALAGMIWSKQFYYYDIPQWLNGDPTQPPPPPQRLHIRNTSWQHVNTADVFSMPDTWEYPWFAAWDLAFHTIPMALIDPEFAKKQLILLGREWYMHPNGQLPAYEWEFSNVNPPVHAWAAWRVFQIDRKQRGDDGDLCFLERVFHKLMINFTWWVNRKDRAGRNVFEGGFLGLDNVGVFDQSRPLPTGGYIDQTDATSWMAMYCLNLMRIALELAQHDIAYEDIATKFFEHFLYIASAMTNIGGQGIGLWDEQDEFFYNVLNMPDGRALPIKIRSIVGLVPLFAVETIEPETLQRLPEFARHLEWFLNYRPDLAQLVSHWTVPGRGQRRLLSLLRGHRMKCLLRRMLDAGEFLSDYGVRSLSRYHLDHPYTFPLDNSLQVAYRPAEADSRVFGGNSNWRGPIWLPLNYLIIESLQKFHHYYGDDFKIECPTGSGIYMTINDVAEELKQRLLRIFLRDNQGNRPVFGDCCKFQQDPHFRDHVLFYEHFHGDNGRGIGASHQTGWTALIAKLLQPRHEDVH